MQLVAYGAQDIYLTGNPQITFFKVVYRRHTNFSMEAIEQTINGQATAGSRVTSTISRNGDLISRIYHSGEVDTDSQPCPVNVGAAIFDTIEIEIGGQQIDKITGSWMEVWSELTEHNPAAMIRGNNYHFRDLHKQGTLFQLMSCMGGFDGSASIQNTSAIIPLPFWFCRNPGLALPLIALQYHEVKLITTLSSTRYLKDNQLHTWVDYIYLDTDERRRFAQVSHEYLIEQLQYFTDSQLNFDLNFNHPVKELIWTHVPDSGNNNIGELDFGTDDGIRGVNFKLKLNGHDRFAERSGEYFTRTQVWEHHTGPGGLNASGNGADIGQLSDSIAVYSFALKPEEHQPSGTCNFSRIDNAQLIVSGTGASPTSTTIYAINYNVLRIMSGMGGLAYSN